MATSQLSDASWTQKPWIIARVSLILAGLAVIVFVIIMAMHKPHLAGLVAGLIFLVADLVFGTARTRYDVSRQRPDEVATDLCMTVVALGLAYYGCFTAVALA